MKNVNIADLIKIKVYQGKSALDVQIECLEPGKDVIFDESALRELNNQLTERCKTMSMADPKTEKFVEEFVYRMVTELYRNGLVELVESQAPIEDHYAKLRKNYHKM